MATKDVTDDQVIQAAIDTGHERDTLGLLVERTGECEKVCFRAIERALSRGLVECGVSVRTVWATDKGRTIIEQQRGQSDAFQVEQVARQMSAVTGLDWRDCLYYLTQAAICWPTAEQVNEGIKDANLKAKGR